MRMRASSSACARCCDANARSWDAYYAICNASWPSWNRRCVSASVSGWSAHNGCWHSVPRTNKTLRVARTGSGMHEQGQGPPTVRMWRQGRHCGECAQGLDRGRAQFPGNPYDGDTLAEQLEQARGLLQVNVIPQVAIVDLGYRGRDVEGVQILHRGQAKTLTRRQWRWIKRRQAVEPVIGHLKQDCRLHRCHLNGAQGDALHVLGCAAGDNLRWRLRWIAFCLPGCRWCGRAPQRAQASCGQQTWHLVFERVFRGD